MTGAEKLVQRVIPAHRTLHVGAHVGKDPGVSPGLDHVHRLVGLCRRPRVQGEGDLELGRLSVRNSGDVGYFSPDDLLLPEKRGDEEPDDWNAKQHHYHGTRNLGAKDAELTAAQPPRVTTRHSG